MKDRLFVPLSTEPFNDYLHHGKDVELRVIRPQFCPKTVFTDRAVELRKGYSLREGVTESEWRLWGAIGSVAVGDIHEILNEFDFQRICPRAYSPVEALAESAMGKYDLAPMIAFEVQLDI